MSQTSGNAPLGKLLAWAAPGTNRHFVIKMGSTYIETRWRIAVWEKPEGETIHGLPGEGFAEHADEAAEMAIEAWETQATLPRKTGVDWYVPTNLGRRLEEKL